MLGYLRRVFRRFTRFILKPFHWIKTIMSLLASIVKLLKGAIANLAKLQAGVDTNLAAFKEFALAFKAFLESDFADLSARVGALEETDVAQQAADEKIEASIAASDARIESVEGAIADSALETQEALDLLNESEELPAA
jgi:hypothetical protein